MGEPENQDSKMPPIDIAAFDQALATLLDTVPYLLWGYYCRLQKAGFDKPEALAIVVAYQATLFGMQKE